MGRRYFGTDGVRGIVGEFLTAELVERLGRAATLWSGASLVLVGRDTRGSGIELEAALVEGIVSAGGTAVIAGVLPTPAVALGALDLGIMITASHNPAEYNGVKFFTAGGRKLTDAEEEAIEALLDAPPKRDRGTIEALLDADAAYVGYVVSHFGSELTGLELVVDCANGACAGLAPEAFERLGATVHAIGNEPDGTNINAGCGATDTALLQRTVRERGAALGVGFDGDGDRLMAVDEKGEVVDGDGIVAILALDLGVEVVAVTQMTNLGFHALMAERGIRVETTDVGDRYVLEALERAGGVLGGEQSGHVIYLRDHVTGDGLAAALLLCSALRGRTLGEAAAVLPHFTQAKENVRVASKELTQPVLAAVDRANAELGETGRVLVRPSGTEPIIRVLVEAQNGDLASEACGTIARLVESELG
ncbi:MAG TPA: phosphoglucosamine mutase [Gaiellaceae bacterium]|jgi:phosphoglucosamine mutase|nr:phosphoglucosamine mutase [Gaiellaceae bacterium]